MMDKRKRMEGGGSPAAARPPSVINGLDQPELGVGFDFDLDAMSVHGGIRREILNMALDESGQKRGADWEVAGGRIRLTAAAVAAVLASIGHGLDDKALEAAKKARYDPAWNLPWWRRMRVQNPAAGHRLILGYLMDGGDGIRCVVPDAERYVIGMHVIVRKSSLASAPDLYELAETQPKQKGRW